MIRCCCRWMRSSIVWRCIDNVRGTDTRLTSPFLRCLREVSPRRNGCNGRWQLALLWAEGRRQGRVRGLGRRKEAAEEEGMAREAGWSTHLTQARDPARAFLMISGHPQPPSGAPGEALPARPCLAPAPLPRPLSRYASGPAEVGLWVLTPLPPLSAAAGAVVGRVSEVRVRGSTGEGEWTGARGPVDGVIASRRRGAAEPVRRAGGDDGIQVELAREPV